MRGLAAQAHRLGGRNAGISRVKPQVTHQSWFCRTLNGQRRLSKLNSPAGQERPVRRITAPFPNLET